MTKTTTSPVTYRALLQNLVCDRYADLTAALAAIDDAHIAGNITDPERHQLSFRAHQA